MHKAPSRSGASWLEPFGLGPGLIMRDWTNPTLA
jgi:hypothetical protein